MVSLRVRLERVSSHLHLHLGRLADAFTQSDLRTFVRRETTIYLCRYSKDVHRT